jgi:hypothetical protein
VIRIIWGRGIRGKGKEREKEKEKGWGRGSEVAIPENATEREIGRGNFENEKGREIQENVEIYVIAIWGREI